MMFYFTNIRDAQDKFLVKLRKLFYRSSRNISIDIIMCFLVHNQRKSHSTLVSTNVTFACDTGHFAWTFEFATSCKKGGRPNHWTITTLII